MKPRKRDPREKLPLPEELERASNDEGTPPEDDADWHAHVREKHVKRTNPDLAKILEEIEEAVKH